jgi:hypothetical protein
VFLFLGICAADQKRENALASKGFKYPSFAIEFVFLFEKLMEWQKRENPHLPIQK